MTAFVSSTEAHLKTEFSPSCGFPEGGPLLAVIGAGGKTAAIEEIAAEGAGRGLSVLFTTTTHIYPLSPPKSRELLVNPPPEALFKALSLPGIVCAGNAAFAGDRKTGRKGGAWSGRSAGFGTPAAGIPEKLSSLEPQLFRDASALAGLTVCEADGSKRLPLKLHRADEPVLPAFSSHCLIAAGLSALGKPVGTCVHRYELNPAWREHPETITGAEQLCFCVMDAVKSVCAASRPPCFRIKILLNQADTLYGPDSGGLRQKARCGSQAWKKEQADIAAASLGSLGLDVRIGSLKREASFLWEWIFG